MGYQVVLVEESQSAPRGASGEGRGASHAVYRLENEDGWDKAEAERRRRLQELLEPGQVRQILRSKWGRRPRPIEQNGFDCLLYPMRAFGLVAPLALGLTISSLLLLFLLFSDAEELDYGLMFFGSVLGLAAIAYAFGFLRCAVYSGSVGDASCIRWPGCDVLMVLKSVAAVAVSFLAGPAVFAVVGFWYWVGGGDLGPVDYLLLWEQGLAAFLTWLLVFTAVTVHDRLSAATPACVVQVAARLGWHGLAVALTAVPIFLVHAAWALLALESRVNEPFTAIFLLLLCWISSLFWLTFLLRWLGVIWFHQTRKAAAAVAAQPAAANPTCVPAAVTR